MAEKTKIIDSVESLEKALKELRKAQEIYAEYSQEQVDAIFKAAAVAANQASDAPRQMCPLRLNFSFE